MNQQPSSSGEFGLFSDRLLILVFGLFITIATGGCGGGGGGIPFVDEDDLYLPSISNLTISPTSVEHGAGGGIYIIQVQFDVIDPDSDVTTIRAEISDGTSLSVPVPPLPGTSGTVIGDVEISTLVSGVFTAEVWVEDAESHQSNRLTADFTILGSSKLSDLALSGVPLDQIFQATLMDYTGTVSLLRSTTTVTATSEDPNATITINGAAVVSGVETGKFTLDHGTNSIDVVVTAIDGTTTETYTVEVTRLSVASFAQRAYVKASNTDAADQFGFDVALDGDTLAVGARLESGAGAVYVFTRDASGTWSQQAHLKASNSDLSDFFGWRIALDGDTLVVGAPSEASSATGIDGDQSDNSAGRAGAVYVFTRDASGIWSQQAYIKAWNTDAGDDFGHAVALDADMLAVGAWLEGSSATGINGDQSDNSAGLAGAVYVFTRDASGTWSQQAYIKASNAAAFDAFGQSVALDGDTLAVGAQREASSATGINGDQSDNNTPDAGAVYVFTRDASDAWSQQAYIKASNTGPDLFSHAIALHDNTLAVGSLFEGSSATGINGDQSDNSAGGAGAVYVFTRDASDTWSQQAYIKASNTFAANSFGEAVALKVDTLAVGARYESSSSTGINGDQNQGGAGNSGAVYVFTRDTNGIWSQQAFVKASNTDANDQFGLGVSLDGEKLAVGAAREDSSGMGLTGNESDNSAENAGAVYLFD